MLMLLRANHHGLRRQVANRKKDDSHSTNVCEYLMCMDVCKWAPALAGNKSSSARIVLPLQR